MTMISRQAPTRGKRPSGKARYSPPADSVIFDTSRLGWTGSALLRFDRLYCAGDISLLRKPAIAIVGSRAASADGQKRAAQLARDLIKAGVTVMSGLAQGIDRAAHVAAIAEGGRTIAVIGTPLDKAYPSEHASLQEEIYLHHLLVSPFPAGGRTFPSHFPERNKVMARLAVATVIMEAGDTSGSLHQAAESLAAGKPVFIAKSVASDARLTWPARFLGKPLVHVFESIDQILRETLDFR